MRALIVAVVATVAVVGCASARPTQEVRLVADRAEVQGCTLLGVVRDDDTDDLKKKARKAGGDTALLTGSTGADVSFIVTFSRVKTTAEVYRCGEARR